MIKWISHIHWGKAALSGLLFVIISMIIHTVESMIMLPYYMMPKYFGVWSPFMMTKAGPPTMDFFIMSTIMNFLTGVSITIIYYYLRDILPKNLWKRTTYFADLMVATSFVFFTIPTFMLFNVPYALLGSWFVSSFVILLAQAIIIVRLIR